MSTRSEIDFVVKSAYTQKNGKIKKYEEHRRVYRHWDGNPEAVIPDLKSFLAWNTGRNTDLEYQTANFLYWSKKTQLENHVKWQKGRNKMPDAEEIRENELLGFGVCDPTLFHGDIEYYYQVIAETGKRELIIEVYEVQRADGNKPITMKSMKKIKTETVKSKEELD